MPTSTLVGLPVLSSSAVLRADTVTKSDTIGYARQPLPVEFFGDLVDVLGSDIEVVLALRLAIPRLPRWSMKAFFSNVRITLSAQMSSTALERLAFLAGLPSTWPVWIDIVYEGPSGELDAEALPHARRLVQSEAMGIIFSKMPVGLGIALLRSREEQGGAQRLPALYLLLERGWAEDADSWLHREHSAWLLAIRTGLAAGQLPLRINAGWGDVPDKLPVREMRLLDLLGVRCEPGLPEGMAETLV